MNFAGKVYIYGFYAIAKHGMCKPKLTLGNDLVNKPIFLGLLRAHKVVTLSIQGDFIDWLTGEDNWLPILGEVLYT